MSTSDLLQWTLGDRLRKARHVAGITSAAMAEHLGVERSTISRFEADRVTPRLAYLRLWAMCCDVDLDWLRYGDSAGPMITNRYLSTELVAA